MVRPFVVQQEEDPDAEDDMRKDDIWSQILIGQCQLLAIRSNHMYKCTGCSNVGHLLSFWPEPEPLWGLIGSGTGPGSGSETV